MNNNELRNLMNFKISHSDTKNIVLNYCDLSQSNMMKGTLFGSSFQHNKMHRVDFWDANLRAVNFSYSDLTWTKFYGSKLEHANFTGATLDNTDFSRCYLNSANFTGASLKGAEFPREYKYLLSEEQIEEVKKFKWFNQDTDRRINLPPVENKQESQNIKLNDTYFASFSRMSHAELDHVDFSESVMESMYFNHSKLRYTDFSDTYLIDAEFHHTDLTGADFTKAKLYKASFYEAIMNEVTFPAKFKELLSDEQINQVGEFV